jgi:hypothetical protein
MHSIDIYHIYTISFNSLKIILVIDFTKIVNGMPSYVASRYYNFIVDHLKQLIRFKPGVQGEVTRSDILKEELAQFMNRTLGYLAQMN